MVLRLPGNGDVPIPLVVPTDAGKFVKELVKLPPGQNLIAFGDRLHWADYVKLWSKVTGVPATFEKGTLEEHAALAPWGFGEEIGEMFAYAMDFGYDGGDPSVQSAKEVSLPLQVSCDCSFTDTTSFHQKLGLDVQATRMEDYIRNEDWSPLLS